MPAPHVLLYSPDASIRAVLGRHLNDAGITVEPYDTWTRAAAAVVPFHPLLLHDHNDGATLALARSMQDARCIIVLSEAEEPRGKHYLFGGAHDVLPIPLHREPDVQGFVLSACGWLDRTLSYGSANTELGTMLLHLTRTRTTAMTWSPCTVVADTLAGRLGVLRVVPSVSLFFPEAVPVERHLVDLLGNRWRHGRIDAACDTEHGDIGTLYVDRPHALHPRAQGLIEDILRDRRLRVVFGATPDDIEGRTAATIRPGLRRAMHGSVLRVQP